MDPHLRSLHQILTAGRFTNSYKFALARTLVDRVPDLQRKNALFLTKREIAQCFLAYYWPLETTFHLRQGIDPEKDPLVMVEIRRRLQVQRIVHGESLIEFRKRNPEECAKLLDVIERKALDDVIPRFHKVRGDDVSPLLYTFTGTIGRSGDGIALSKDAASFLVEHGEIIEIMAVSAWARFTEQFTTAPRLIEKLSGARPERGSLMTWRATLEEIQGGSCFYCGTNGANRYEVDHVLPWSFVLEDRTWNLVLACNACNSMKRDRLTDALMLERLLLRNERIAQGDLPVEAKFLRHFEEWHTRDLGGHVRALYDQARQDGFPAWKGH